MRTWSLERAVVSLGAGAAVVVQGLLESLWPSHDYDRVLAGQPGDEWLWDKEAETEVWEPPLNSSEIVGVRQLIEERFGSQTSPVPPTGESPSPVEQVPPLAPGEGTPRTRPAGCIPTRKRLASYLHAAMHNNGFDWDETADALLQEFRIIQK